MKKFKHSDNQEFSRRDRREKKQRGGAKNHTHAFRDYEKESDDITNNDLSDFPHVED